MSPLQEVAVGGGRLAHLAARERLFNRKVRRGCAGRRLPAQKSPQASGTRRTQGPGNSATKQQTLLSRTVC